MFLFFYRNILSNFAFFDKNVLDYFVLIVMFSHYFRKAYFFYRDNFVEPFFGAII